MASSAEAKAARIAACEEDEGYDDDAVCFCVPFSTILDYHREQLQNPNLTAPELMKHFNTKLKEASKHKVLLPEVVPYEDHICFSHIKREPGYAPAYKNRCIVRGLSKNAKIEELDELFSCYGDIVESKIINGRETGEPRGFGFVSFAYEKSMYDAVEGLNGHNLGGHTITVTVSKLRKYIGSKDIKVDSKDD